MPRIGSINTCLLVLRAGMRARAAGGVEAVYSILCLNNKRLPHTLNLESAIETKKIDFIAEKAIDYDTNYILSNSFGFGGTNVSLVLEKFDESKLQ